MRISEQQFRELLDRYLNNTASPEERELLDKFFDSYNRVQPEELPDADAIEHAMLDNIHERLNVRSGRRGRMLRLWMPLAAAIGLFVLAYFFFDHGKNPSGTQELAAARIQQSTERGQRLVTLLPDGTRVHLNAESKLTYSSAFDQQSRDVILDGEAYFEVVSSSRPFRVHTHAVKTEVLGTSFNVKSRGQQDVEVTLVEGSLKVIGRTPGNAALLRPNEQAVVAYHGHDMRTRTVNVLSYIGWKDNTLFFERTSLKDAVRALESWYDVRITILNPAIEGCVITAKYQNEPLGNVLSSFQFLLSLEIGHPAEGKYTLNGKGCKPTS